MEFGDFLIWFGIGWVITNLVLSLLAFLLRRHIEQSMESELTGVGQALDEERLIALTVEVDHMDLGQLGIALDQAHCAAKGPALDAQRQQTAEQALLVSLRGFVAPANPRTLPNGGTKTGFAGGQFFQPQRAIAELVLVSQAAQTVQRGVSAGKQPVQVGLGGKVDVFRINHFGHTATQAQAAQLFVAAQLLVEQRVLRLDHLGFQQQGPNFTRRTDVADALGLAQHAGFVRRAQVRQQAGPDVDAFAYIQGQVALLPMKDVDPGACGGVFDGGAQVLRVFVDAAFFKVFAAAA